MTFKHDDLQPQELDDSLIQYIQHDPVLGETFHHPLFVSIMYSPMLNAAINNVIKHKEVELALALRDEDYQTYIWLHERPYRAEALSNLLECAELALREYSKLLHDVWIDCEGPSGALDLFVNLFAHASSELWMTPEALATWHALPEVITVHRGRNTKENTPGLSWTLSMERATWFANRWPGESFVGTKQIRKDECFGYTNERDEDEIIIIPDV